MTKPTLSHVSSVCHSIHLMTNGMKTANSPARVKALEHDIFLQRQVVKILRNIIENPTLPFLEDRKGHEPDPIDQLLDAAGKIFSVTDALVEQTLNPIEDEPNESF